MADQPTYADLQKIRAAKQPTFSDLQAAREKSSIAEEKTSMFEDKPGTYYSNVLPIARDEKTGGISLAFPEPLRIFGRGVIGMAKDVAGEGRNPGSNLTADELGALATLSPALKSAQSMGYQIASGVENIPGKTISGIKNAGVPPIDSSASNGLWGTSQNLYKQAKQIGASYTPKLTDKLLDYAKSVQSAPPSVIEKMGSTPFDAFKSNLEKYRGQPFSLDEWHAIDKRLTQAENDAFKSGDLEQAHHFEELQDGLRDIIVKSANEKGMMIGPQGGIEALRAAQQTFAQSKKVQIIEDIGRKAAMTQNPITATQTALKNLLNGKKAGLFDEDEIKMLEHAQKTGILIEPLRRLGGRLGGYIGAGVGAAAGHGVASVPMAIAGHVIGQAVTSVPRAAANAMHRARVQKAINMVAKPQPQLPPIPQTLQIPSGVP